METKNFRDKVVLITGASSGIGAATAKLFAKEGADVAMVGRNQKKLDTVAAECAKIGKKPLIINADVAKDEDAKRIVKETIDKYGKLDILVNNAGLGSFGTILGGDFIQAYDTVMSVNTRGVINLTVLAAPHLVATKGNIINVSSTAGMRTTTASNFAPYSISKAALDYFTRSAAFELASSGIRVNSVNPGPTMTDFFDNSQASVDADDLKPYTALKRVCTSEEIADMIAYVASDKARGITGSLLVVDNGFLLM